MRTNSLSGVVLVVVFRVVVVTDVAVVVAFRVVVVTVVAVVVAFRVVVVTDVAVVVLLVVAVLVVADVVVAVVVDWPQLAPFQLPAHLHPQFPVVPVASPPLAQAPPFAPTLHLSAVPHV